MSLIPETTMLVLSGFAALTNPIDYSKEDDASETLQYLRIGYANDETFNRDCNYTQGARLDYCQSFGTKIESCFGVSLSQNIYTPETHTDGAVPGQHPYAATLALGFAGIGCRENYGFVVEAQVGTTGDPALGRWAQNGVHRLINCETWDGWDDQVPAEPTFQLNVCPSFNLPFLCHSFGGGWGTDGLLFTRAEAGTVRLAGGAGVGVRFGKNLPGSMQVLGSRAGTYGAGPIYRPEYKLNKASYFLVANVYGEYVGRDIAIDGGVFHHFDRTCGRTPWQVEGAIGLGISHHNLDYFMGVRLHSRAYRTQDKNSAMGVFSVGWKW